MKALSLREPWLSAILDCGKRIENRVWNTPFRGQFLLQAAKGMTKLEYDQACQFMKRIGVEPPSRSALRENGIVGAASLVGVIRPAGTLFHRQEKDKWSKNVNVAWHMAEQFGFVLADVVDFKKVIPCKGMLGFFEVPADVEEEAWRILAT